MGFFDKVFGARTPGFAPTGTLVLGGHPVGLAFVAADRKLAALTGEGTLVLADVGTCSERARVSAHEAGALALAVDASTSRVATGGMDGHVRVHDASTGALAWEASVAPAGRWVEHLAWWDARVLAAQGRSVAVASRDGVERTLGPHASTVAGLSVGSVEGSPLLAVARFGGADVWDLAAPSTSPSAAPRALEWPSSLVSIAWSPDGRFLAAGCQDSALHFWRMPAGDDSMMGGYASKPKVLAWSPRGDALASAGGEDVVVWSFRGAGPEGTTPLQLRGHARTVTALAWSPDGKHLASGGRDGALLVFATSGEAPPVARLELGGSVEHVAFSADGAWLAATSSEGTLQIVRR
jgi:WD40 repeat protein